MIRIKSSRRPWAVLPLAIAASAAFGQGVPNIGDALRQVAPPEIPTKPEATLPSIGGVLPIEPPMTALPQGPTVNVKAIDVVGNRVIDRDTLMALVADAAGHEMNLADLEALALRITKHYRVNGYFVARAYVPAQDVTSGTVSIRVVEGNYGRFHLTNESLVRDRIVQGMLDDVKGYDIVSLDTLERAMLIINDTPGVQVTRADVMPGERVGTSDFAVDTTATPRFAGFVMGDNYGSAYTGKERLSFNVDVNSPTGSGDRLSASGLTSDGSGLYNGRLGYSTSLAPNGLRGEMAFSRTHYQLGDTYAPLNALGTANVLEAGLTYPLRRIRAQTVEASLLVSHKDLVDEIRAASTRTPKKATAVTAGLSLRDERALGGFDGLTQASVNLTVGRLSIRDDIALAQDAAGPQTNGNYGKVAASLTRVSLLPRSFTLTTALRLQHALDGKSLDGSERMAVSGTSGVMAYPSGELIGDNAILAHVDLARPLPLHPAVQANWLVFADHGDVRPANERTPGSRRGISDAGLGLNVSWQGALLKAILAHRVGGAAVSEPFPRNKFLVQAGWIF